MGSTLLFSSRPRLRARASTAGPKEGKGPLSKHFDEILPDDLLGQTSWELAEGMMLQQTMERCLEHGGMAAGDVETVLAGDLVNQLMPSGLAARALKAPFFGLYGACSTAIEAIILGAALVDGGYRKNALCGASSHFCTAERQYRFPLELGNQRPPSSQWTATAAGAFLIDGKDEPAIARIECGTVGRVVDYQITDANHMGAAMAPSVADTITAHFDDTDRSFADYDLVATGDLGKIGRKLLIELLERRGVRVNQDRLIDCGAELFDPDQGCHAGGSGCGCVASVTAGYLLSLVERGQVNRLLVIGSGALVSTTSSQQGQSIPGVAHAVALEGDA